MNQAINKSFTDYGGNGQIVVLLHGFLASSKYWAKIQPELSHHGMRVIAIDLLGFGAAPKPRDSDYGYSAHITHIEAMLTELRITKPFTLIGHSMGALIASKYSILHAKQIESLVLLHPPLYKDKQELRSALHETSRLYRFLLESKFRRLGWVPINLLLTSKIGNHTHHSRECSMQNVIEKTKIFQELAIMKNRALLVVGTQDRRQYIDNLQAASISNFVKVILEDVSHHSPLQNPVLINRLITNFITR